MIGELKGAEANSGGFAEGDRCDGGICRALCERKAKVYCVIS